MRGPGLVQPRDDEAQAGFSLVESLLAMTLLLVGAGSFSAAIVLSMRVNDTNRESILARMAARGTLETVQMTAFAQIFATYNESADDDPGIPGSAPGASFDVPGLAVRAGDPDGMAGRILFPRVAGDPPEVLRETALDPSLGMPHDLTGEGVLDGDDHALDYRLLPVRVVVDWTSTSGQDRSIGFFVMLAER